MNSPVRESHPSAEELALYAGGDLPRVARWRLSRHLRGCPRCAAEAAAFRDASRGLAAGIEPLPDANWNTLAREMNANIRLGLAAGQCVGQPPQVSSWAHPWQAAVAVAAILLVVVSGWWWTGPKGTRVGPGLGIQNTMTDPGAGREIVLRTTLGGIGVERNGQALALAHEGRPGGTVTVSAVSSGSLRARYVDQETGQVTIHHVYAE